MAHHTVKSSYSPLVERLNRYPQGAPPSKVLYQILAMLFSQKEAEFVAQFPLRQFTARRAARVWRLAGRGTRSGNIHHSVICERAWSRYNGTAKEVFSV